MWSVAVYFAGRILTCRSSSWAQPFLSLHFFLFIYLFYSTPLLPPSFHFPLSVILSAPRSNFGSMEPRGALSQSYLHPRLSSSSSRSSSTASSSSSPLPLVQEESSMRILWCTRAGEFVFSSSLYFCCVVSGGKWWRGCSSTTLQPIPSITSQLMEIHTATRLHWFLPALGFSSFNLAAKDWENVQCARGNKLFFLPFATYQPLFQEQSVVRGSGLQVM